MQTSICMENEDITQTLDFTYPKNSSGYCLKVQVIFQHFLSHTKSQTSLIGIPQLLWSSREKERAAKKNEAVLTSSFINFEERKSAAKGRRGDEIMMSN